MLKSKEQLIVILILVAVGVFYRLLPHPANFAPIAAVSLFSGFYFRRYFVFLVPILSMFLSDFFIGFYNWKLMVVVYASFVLIGFIGILIRKNKSILSVIGCSLMSSVLFFLLTNFAVWFFSAWYPHNLQGLESCYLMAVPFFRNTALGDLFYVSVVFGCYEILAQPKEKLGLIFVKSKASAL